MKLRTYLKEEHKKRVYKVTITVAEGENFPRRLVDFIKKLQRLGAEGASRTVGITDDPEMKNVKIYIDGDGADKIMDVKLSLVKGEHKDDEKGDDE